MPGARRTALVLLLAVAWVGAWGVAGQDLPPLDPRAQSLEVTEDGAIVLVEPHEGAARRGTLVVGARFPISRRIATAPSAACNAGAWARLADDAWVCASSLRASPSPPGAADEPRVENGALLPFRYAFVHDDGTHAYARPDDYEADEFVQTFGEGFGLSLVEHRRGFSRTRHGLWVADESLRFAQGSDFGGVEVASAEELARVAWVVREGARITAGRRTLRRAHRRERFVVTGTPRPGTLAIDDGGTAATISTRDVARPALSARPSEVLGSDEPWIDVDVRSQTLVAYRGDRPTYATLVSTGRAGPAMATPLGVHRVWAKLAMSDMDDLEREDVARNYRIEDVPWVQFFDGSAGLHATFWHDRFGERRSHGCVNLAPRDARALFSRTRPLLPPGWSAILPTTRNPGSVVRVR